jgi:SAM-dependent methyltransferase
MDRNEIRRLYDPSYADSYEGKFLHSDLGKSDRDFEVRYIGETLGPGDRWLDVACGTGYFLSQFPHIDRAGADLSPAMLDKARQANPGVTFTEWDFRDPNPEWNDRFDLVTCMWYAYGLVDSLKQVLVVIDNLTSWTKPAGRCLLPISDPRQIARVNYPYQTLDTPWDGQVFIEGIMWSYVEEGGKKVHAHQISPTPEFIIDAMRRKFHDVTEVVYPPAFEGWDSRRAILGTNKRTDTPPPDLRFESRR